MSVRCKISIKVHKMLTYTKQRTGVKETIEALKNYESTGEIDNSLANYLINLSIAQGINMHLKLQQQDYDDAILHGVYSCIKYGLKQMKKIDDKKKYYYLLMSCKSGICRFLEKLNKHNKRYVVTDFTEESWQK